MIPHLRKDYNTNFSEEKYERLLSLIEREAGERPSFRVSETPIFVPERLTRQLLEACESLSDLICRPDFKQLSEGALLPENFVPGETDHTAFLMMDFGLCEGENGDLVPQLIEIQGFPSLFFYQDLLARSYREAFDIPQEMPHLFGVSGEEEYVQKLRNTIVGDADPENVVLLEIFPETQNTRVDFWLTEKALGVKVVNITDLKVEGKVAYYLNEKGRKVKVERLYNRTIFDELYKYRDLKREFYFQKEYDFRWVGHPHWFFRISKHTLPFLKSPYVPESWFLHEWEGGYDSLQNYVLKPLYSFSGQGVILSPTKADIENIPEEERANYILQKKVKYVPVIQTPDEPAKVEIRMMHIWEQDAPRPELLISLIRLSKGEMIGVRYNKDKTWVGSSAAFFEMP
ncbi:MAG: hypothetical protein CMN32_12005 [Saprospirales bacterium]|nr:hypothetical protein [Saprospirales bacterium]